MARVTLLTAAPRGGVASYVEFIEQLDHVFLVLRDATTVAFAVTPTILVIPTPWNVGSESLSVDTVRLNVASLLDTLNAVIPASASTTITPGRFTSRFVVELNRALTLIDSLIP